MKVNLEYKIGKIINTSAKLYTVIGFEYVQERGLRYCLAHQQNGECKWEYMYKFEIELLSKNI